MNNENNENNEIKEIKEKENDEFFKHKKDNYDTDSPENINSIKNNSLKNNNNNINLEETKEEVKFKKAEEFINFPKAKEEDENKIIRISNLKDNELPLEDKLQIENQVDNDNDNESEQIEVLENILSNFEKEKYKNKFLEYKNNKKIKIKSHSITNTKNNILDKIKHDIAAINFEQTLNQICNNRNYNLILKGEKLNVNMINKNRINKNKSKNNISRIEELRKKLFSKSNISSASKTKSISNHKRNENKIFFNKLDNEENFYNSCNNFFNKTHKQRLYNTLFNDTNNVKEIKINHFNINHIYNNFYDTFRNKRINNEITNKTILPVSTERKSIINNNITIESQKKSINNNSNQFFYNVFTNSMRKYPYLYLLKNKVNKMKYDDFNKKKFKEVKNKVIIAEEKESEPKLSILDKIKMQKDIFQKEIDKYKKK